MLKALLKKIFGQGEADAPETAEEPLILAARIGDCDLIEELLNQGANINCRVRQISAGNTPFIIFGIGNTPVNIYSAGNTPLIEAARQGWLYAVMLLLARGAAIDAQNDAGETALITAAFFHHNAVIRILLAHGADISICNRNMATATSAYEFDRCNWRDSQVAKMLTGTTEITKPAIADEDAATLITALQTMREKYEDISEGYLELAKYYQHCPNLQKFLIKKLADAAEASGVIQNELMRLGVELTRSVRTHWFEPGQPLIENPYIALNIAYEREKQLRDEIRSIAATLHKSELRKVLINEECPTVRPGHYPPLCHSSHQHNYPPDRYRKVIVDDAERGITEATFYSDDPGFELFYWTDKNGNNLTKIKRWIDLADPASGWHYPFYKECIKFDPELGEVKYWEDLPGKEKPNI